MKQQEQPMTPEHTETELGEAKITLAELAAIFPGRIPGAMSVLWTSPGDWTLAMVRSEIIRIAALAALPAPTGPVTAEIAYIDKMFTQLPADAEFFSTPDDYRVWMKPRGSCFIGEHTLLAVTSTGDTAGIACRLFAALAEAWPTVRAAHLNAPIASPPDEGLKARIAELEGALASVAIEAEGTLPQDGRDQLMQAFRAISRTARATLAGKPA